MAQSKYPSKRKGSSYSSSSGRERDDDDGEADVLLPSSSNKVPPTAAFRPKQKSSSSNLAEAAAAAAARPSLHQDSHQSIFLDDMIRSSRDDLMRSSKKRREQQFVRSESSGAGYYSPSWSSRVRDPHGKAPSLLRCATSHARLVLNHHPLVTIALCASVLAASVLTFQRLVVDQTDPTRDVRRGVGGVLIDADYSNLESVYDVALGSVDHWCLTGDDHSCTCEDPLEPLSKGEQKHWVQAHVLNKLAVSNVADKTVAKDDRELDVIFLGESIVESWAGRALGKSKTKLLTAKRSFDKTFNETSKGKFDGLALGIAGDTAPNVLWRLLHGEMHKDLNPKVWWLVLGTNDLAVGQCSEEIVLLGVLRVIEEIVSKKPNAHIVVNSILPMTSNKDGWLAGAPPPPVESSADDESSSLALVKESPPTSTKPSGSKWSSLFSSRSSTPKKSLSEDGTSSEAKGDDEKKKKSASTKGDEKDDRSHVRRRTRSLLLPKFSQRSKEVSLWSSVEAINEQLKSFCDKHSDHMTFFDVNSFFIEHRSHPSLNGGGEEEESLYVSKDLLNDRGRPTLLGHQLWFREISRTLSSIIRKDEPPSSEDGKKV